MPNPETPADELADTAAAFQEFTMAELIEHEGGAAFPFQVDVGPSGTFLARGMTYRDYLIAHAPAAPHAWFSPTMETECPGLPSRPLASELTEEENAALAEYDNDVLDIHEMSDHKVRRYLEEVQRCRRAVAEWQAEYTKRFWLEWPAAWADAQLELREKHRTARRG